MNLKKMTRFAQQRFKGTFSNQNLIPKLPVPSLQNLQEKYLKSLKPILPDTEYQKTEKIVQDFLSPKGFGQELQKRLIQYDSKQKNSWLEQFWLDKAYLEWREPSMINVNWWCQFVDHPEHPADLLDKKPPKGVLSSFQIKRAAGLISNLLNFNDLLNTETFPAEMMKEKPLCMNQYKNIFGTSRVPGDGKDSLVHQYPTKARHIIVMVKNQMFKVNVYGNANARLPLAEIERLLLAVGKEVLSTPLEPPVGILTAGHRDTTYEGTKLLSNLSPQNKENFETINSALFIVCLDDYSTLKNIDLSHHQIFHNHDGSNRWFDKAIQLIVSNNGRAGINGEHTPSDAVVPGTVMNYVLKNEPAIDPETVTLDPQPYPEKLTWTVNDQVTGLMATASATAKKLIQDTESCLFQTDIYGSRFMKEVAKTSPDAYVQIAMQLAYWRLYKQPTPVYESASIRLFKHGRTETGRSMSSESLEFIKSFDNDDILYDTKRELFQKAIAAQSGYLRDASTGKGIDRHMLGLRCMVKPIEAEKATMFTDPSYLNSMNFKLSTSNMSPGTYFYGGFGPVVPEGYGINYAIGKDDLKFSISCKKSCPTTNSFKFRDALERTLIDMFILFPKRSQVWGKDWKEKHVQEKKEEYRLNKMKQLSDKLKEKQSILAERYKTE